MQFNIQVKFDVVTLTKNQFIIQNEIKLTWLMKSRAIRKLDHIKGNI